MSLSESFLKRLFFKFISESIEKIDEYYDISGQLKVEEYKDKAKDTLNNYTSIDIERSYERKQRLREEAKNANKNIKYNYLKADPEKEREIEKEEFREEVKTALIVIFYIIGIILFFIGCTWLNNLQF